MDITVSKTLVSYWPSTDWSAYITNECPDGPVGYGASPVKALEELKNILCDDDDVVAAVDAKIEAMTEVVGVPV